MTTFFNLYIASWSTACLIAVLLAVKNHKTIILFQKKYRRYLFVKWKLVTFITASSCFVILAPYTGDPTWDYFDAAFMSALTFASAPWAIATIFRFIRGKERLSATYIAICAWMFSASWSYDIYLVFRDGLYPITWFSNIFASSVLYVSAGLFWNLEYRERRGVIFGFMADDWPCNNAPQKFDRLMYYALPFMVLAAAIFAPFLL